MKLLCLSLLSFLLYSCTNEENLSLGETIQVPHLNRSNRLKTSEEYLNFIQINEIKNLKIITGDENLLSTKLNYSKRHFIFEQVQSDLENLDISSFLEVLHTKEITEFQSNQLKFDSPKENCEIEFEVEFKKPKKMDEKIALRDIDLDLIIELTTGEKLNLPAMFEDRNTELVSERFYLVRSLKELDNIKCDDLIKKRGRLSVKFHSFRFRNYNDYFTQLKSQIYNKDLFLNLEEDHLKIKLDNVGVNLKDWSLVANSFNNLYFKKNLLNLKKKINWTRLDLEITNERVIDLFDAEDELFLKLSGNLLIPFKQDDGGQYKPVYAGEVNITCHKTGFFSKIKSKEILKEEDLKKLPITIKWGHRERLIWELPDIKIENKDKFWFIRIPLNFTKDQSEKILNFNTVIKEHHFDLSPKYKVYPEICDTHFEKETKLSEDVSEKAIYQAEIYFR